MHFQQNASGLLHSNKSIFVGILKFQQNKLLEFPIPTSCKLLHNLSILLIRIGEVPDPGADPHHRRRGALRARGRGIRPDAPLHGELRAAQRPAQS